MDEDSPLERQQGHSDCDPALIHETIDEILQVAVGFHGNGDVEQAASIYRSVLDCDSENPHANFNLATICHGNGDMDEAIACYRQVLKQDPENFQVLYYLAGAYCDQGCFEFSVNTYLEAIKIQPDHADSHFNLGIVYQHQSKPDLACACYERAVEINPEHAGAYYNLGLVCYEADKFDDAEKNYLKAIALAPGDVDALHNLAVVHTRRRHFEEAATWYIRALEITPDDAALHNSLGLIWKQLKNFDKAESSFKQAVSLKSDFGAAYTNLAVILQTTGNNDEAVDCYVKAIELGHQTKIADHMLAALTGSTRTTIPDDYVRDLFDSYAEEFDDSLVHDLEYNTPLSLRKFLESIAGKRRCYNQVLDLGCGTGLAGREFREVSGHLTGIDVSSKMLEKADGKGIYNELHCCELLGFLAAVDREYDLIIAADVMNYLGGLDRVLKKVEKRLARNGLFAFSIEKLENGGGCVLQTSGRYAHDKNYIEEVCAQSGLVIRASQNTSVRKDRGEWVKGLLFVVEKARESQHEI